MRRRKLYAGLVFIVIAGLLSILITLIVVVSRKSPEETVGRFFDAVQSRDAETLAGTLSGGIDSAGDLAAALAPDTPLELKVDLVRDIPPEKEQALDSSIEVMPEVRSYTYYPGDQGAIERLIERPRNPAYSILLNSAASVSEVASRLQAVPGVATDGSPREKAIRFSLKPVVRAYLERVIPGIRFKDITYATKVKGDRAGVTVLRGTITKVDESGREIPVSRGELARLKIFPTDFLLRKEDGGWYITSLPTRGGSETVR